MYSAHWQWNDLFLEQLKSVLQYVDVPYSTFLLDYLYRSYDEPNSSGNATVTEM
jgi:hypothetical protein